MKSTRTKTFRLIKALKSKKGITCSQAVSRFDMTPNVFYAFIRHLKQNKNMDVQTVPTNKGLNRYYTPASVSV